MSDAVALEALDEQARQLGIVLRHHPSDLEHSDARPQQTMGLRHLEADRPAADDDEMLGQHAVLEQGLIGEEGHVLEARNRRRARRRAGGDDDAPRAHRRSPARTSRGR